VLAWRVEAAEHLEAFSCSYLREVHGAAIERRVKT
jgi:hypothetical protein